MAKTAVKRATRAKTTPRADQLRPLNLPQPITVELDGAGLPSVIASCYRRIAVPPDHSGEQSLRSERIDNDSDRKLVESILEIWHVDDEWWRDPISRRYVEVILEGGKHVVLYEDSNTKVWFMQRP